MDVKQELKSVVHLNSDDLLKKICVSRPYFALNDLVCINNETVRASFILENISFQESFSVSSGEAGRHLAILGSCSLAMINPEPQKYYYLAVHAIGGNSNVAKPVHRDNNRVGKKFYVEAKAIVLDLKKKSGKAEAKIYNLEGLEVSSLVITYKVFRCDLFRRLFSSLNEAELPIGISNPYIENCKILDLKSYGSVMTGRTGPIEAEQCVGHFDDYPALPVAMLCSYMFEMAGFHYRSLKNNDLIRFCVDRIDLYAHRLASVGEDLLIKSVAQPDGKMDSQFVVEAVDSLGIVVSQVFIKLYVES